MILTSNRRDRAHDRVATTGRPHRATSTTRLALALALGLATTLGHATPARAGGLVISAPDLTVTGGSSGSFLVLIADTDPTASYRVAGDTFELTLTGPAGFSFTDVSTATGGTPYIYASSTANDFNLPLYTAPMSPFPTADFIASDTFDFLASPGYTTLSPGDVFALGLVSYSVDPSAQAGSMDTIGFNLTSTSLSDFDLNAVPFTTTNGSISIGIASVPEPATLGMGMIAITTGTLAFGSGRGLVRTNGPRKLRLSLN